MINSIKNFSETDYGCCPDNVTAARGQDFLGCGCSHSPNGCCHDQVTVAPQEGVEGCPCYTSEFGCCMDGQTAAQGHNLEGKVHPIKPCKLCAIAITTRYKLFCHF